MRAFTQLLASLERASGIHEKIALLEAFFRSTPAEDAAWALHLLHQPKLRRAVSLQQLKAWAQEVTGFPSWMLDECNAATTDWAETLALLLPSPTSQACAPTLSELMQGRLLALVGKSDAEKGAIVLRTWNELPSAERLLWHKLLGGRWKSRIPPTLLLGALSKVSGLEIAVLAQRMERLEEPSPDSLARLMSKDSSGPNLASPYAFHPTSPLEGSAESLGYTSHWQVEWKWPGLRAQLVRKKAGRLVWSTHDVLLTDALPELATATAALPEGTVMDGVILAWKDGGPLPLAQLQRRLNATDVSRGSSCETPVIFMAVDLLESAGEDFRCQPLSKRRERLEVLMTMLTVSALSTSLERKNSQWSQGDFFEPEMPELGGSSPQIFNPIHLSPVLSTPAWPTAETLRSEARTRGMGGLMLKRRDSAYGATAESDSWLAWLKAPLICLAVLTGAQPNSAGPRNSSTQFTLALWRGAELVPVGKLESGLSACDTKAVATFISENTLARFGPLRSVKPELVFELAFEDLTPSTRHKSGWILHSPRILRRRPDLEAKDADKLDTLTALHAMAGPG